MILSRTEFTYYIGKIRRIFISFAEKPRVIFIFGAQRSGTNMLCNLIGSDYRVEVHNEDDPRAFDHFRVRPIQVLHQLVRKSNAKYVLFKPNLDLQNSHILLHEFPGSLGFWIYRNYWDVVNSSTEKWDKGQLSKIKYLVERDLDGDRWYTERVDESTKIMIKSLYHEEMNEESAGALKWYMRNQFYFKNRFDSNDQVTLIDYESVVNEKDSFLELLLSKSDISINREYLSKIHKKSIDKGILQKEKIDLPVRIVCDELLEKLKNFTKDIA